jgi:hypothetical protein
MEGTGTSRASRRYGIHLIRNRRAARGLLIGSYRPATAAVAAFAGFAMTFSRLECLRKLQASMGGVITVVAMTITTTAANTW